MKQFCSLMVCFSVNCFAEPVQAPIQRLSDLTENPSTGSFENAAQPATTEPVQDFTETVLEKLKVSLQQQLKDSFQLELDQQVQGPASLFIQDIKDIHITRNNTRVTAQIHFQNPYHQPISVSAKLTLMTLVPVPVRVIKANEPLDEKDFILTEVPLTQVTSRILTDIKGVAGFQARLTALKPGVPVKLSEIQRIEHVSRGKEVIVQLVHPFMRLQTHGTALDSGGTGDSIRVMNNESRKVIRARVVGPRLVQIDQGIDTYETSS